MVDREIGSALEGWIIGRRRPGALSVVVHATTPAAGRPEDAGELWFVPDAPIGPAADTSPGDGQSRVPYRGDLTSPGAGFTVAGRTVDVCDYLAGTFLDIAASTCIRITGEDDWRGFLDDADLARSQGVFVPQLSHPAVLLAGRCALAGDADAGASSYVDEDVVRRFAPEGLEQPGGDILIDTFGGAVDPESLGTGRRDRPWLGRYLAACDLIRRQPVSGRMIVGFGTDILTDGAADRAPDANDPFLSQIGEDVFLIEDLSTGRRVRSGRRAAQAVESLQTSSTADRACERFASACGIHAAEARALLSSVRSRLGFDPTRRHEVAA